MIQNRFVCDRCGRKCSDSTYFTIDIYGHDINPSGDNIVTLDTAAQNVCTNTSKMFGTERHYCKWCKEQIELFALKVPIFTEIEQQKVSILKKMFCKHKNHEVVCWHWTHGETTNEIRFIEIQYKCKDCGKYYFRYLKNWVVCEHFAENHKGKQWSDDCKPVL
jgi:hypothetical protein